MIEIKEVSKRYDVRNQPSFLALDSVSLTVHTGSTCGVIGLSGAGKTTLLRCLVGLETIDTGEIRINHQNLFQLKGSQRREFLQTIGVVFQGYQLLEQKSVVDNIAWPLKIARYNDYDTRMRVQELIKVVGLEGKDHHFPSQLSGGQRQRVAIARALALHPSTLFLDELTSALDPLTTAQMMTLIETIQQRYSITIFLITHQMEVVKRLCDNVVVLDHGKIVESGTFESLLSHSNQAITRLLLGGHDQ